MSKIYQFAIEVEQHMADAQGPGSWIKEGVQVKLIEYPGTVLQIGDIGIADEAPSDLGPGGLFWATFAGERRHHLRVREVVPV